MFNTFLFYYMPKIASKISFKTIPDLFYKSGHCDVRKE